MWRSPFFWCIGLFIFFACQQKSTNNLADSAGGRISEDTLIRNFAEKAAEFQAQNQYDSAFSYFSKSKDRALLAKDSAYVSFNLIAMAQIQQSFADYASSEETLIEALPFLEEHTDNYLAALNMFGIAAKEVKNYDVALNYYKDLVSRSKDSIRQASVANNIALLYVEKKQYPSAIAVLEPFLNGTYLDTFPKVKARIMDNLGFIYFKNGQSDRGLELLNKGLKIRTQMGDSYGLIMSYLHLAEFYKSTNPKNTEINARQAYQLATKHNSIDERLDALALLMMYHSKVGINKFAIKYTQLNDSITFSRNTAKNQFAKIKYDSQNANLEAVKYKGEKAEVDLKLKAKQLQSYVMVFGVFALVLFIAYLIHYYKVKSKQERLQTTYNTETRISKMLHDELANDVFYTMNFAETQDLENAVKKEQLLDHLDQIYHKTRNISKENSPIDTSETFFTNLKQMLSSYKSPKIEVIIRNGSPIDWLIVSEDKKIAIQRVLQELMVNMKKHSQAGFVVIGFDAAIKEVLITYADNGIGCSETAILKNGLQNAENRIQAIKGQLTFDFSSPKGFKAKITVPY